jgi:hypothetical protein
LTLVRVSWDSCEFGELEIEDFAVEQAVRSTARKCQLPQGGQRRRAGVDSKLNLIACLTTLLNFGERKVYSYALKFADINQKFWLSRICVCSSDVCRRYD